MPQKIRLITGTRGVRPRFAGHWGKLSVPQKNYASHRGQVTPGPSHPAADLVALFRVAGAAKHAPENKTDHRDTRSAAAICRSLGQAERAPEKQRKASGVSDAWP